MLQPSLPYNLLKFALQMCRRPPRELAADEYKAVRSRAEAECLLQEKVLASKEGMKVVVADTSIAEAVAALARRYESPQAFAEDLAVNDMDLRAMAAALAVNLAVETTMAQVADRVEPPDEAHVAEVFAGVDKQQPEQRRLRHILITINDQFPENRRPQALARITQVRDKALVPGLDFSALAQRYSECPSALKGGSISPVVRGGIDPSLEEALFAMEVGEISAVVESKMGFHILLCEEVIPAKEFDDTEILAKIRHTLLRRSRKKAVQAWLATL